MSKAVLNVNMLTTQPPEGNVSKCSLYISVIVCDQDRQDETPY